MNALAWAPHEHGLALACASSDGSVSVLTHRPDGSWEAAKVPRTLHRMHGRVVVPGAAAEA